MLTFAGLCTAACPLGGHRSALVWRRRRQRLLAEEQADVEAEAGEEADVQQDDHQQVPATGPPETGTI